MQDSAFQELLGEFVLEARERVDEVESLVLRIESGDDAERRDALAKAKRELHTLKGNSGMMGFTHLQQRAHELEDGVAELDLAAPRVAGLLTALDAMRRELAAVAPDERGDDDDAADDAEAEGGAEAGLGAGGSVRVPFARVDRLVETLAETLIFRNRLSDAIGRGMVASHGAGLGGATAGGDGGGLAVASGTATAVAAAAAQWEDVESAHTALEKTLNRLQEQVTELGMVPLHGLLRRLGRIVHDESAREGKRVELAVAGGDTPIDRSLLETAGEALGHLVRNAVIHGVEEPAERRARRKPEVGKVRLEASVEANQVRIVVADDGAGIDDEALRRRARELGLGTDSPFEVLFAEGVSTRGGTDLSAGRGVGLAAVRRTVEAQGGRIRVQSERGRGTAFELRLPLTASILRSLLVAVDGEDYALPLAAVAETLELERKQLREVHHTHVLRWREILVPVIDLGQAFATAAAPRDEGFVLVVEVNGRHRALLADAIAGIRDIVVKGLDTLVGRPPGISGSTILGDGRVIMILDPAALTSMAPTAVRRGDAADPGQPR